MTAGTDQQETVAHHRHAQIVEQRSGEQTVAQRPVARSFFDSYECRSGLHCQSCRATDTSGHAFRRSIADAFDLDEISWPCPHNRPWNHPSRGERLPMPPVDKTPLATRRRAICDACPDRRVCPVFRNEATRPCEAANYLALAGSFCTATVPRWTASSLIKPASN